MLCVVGDNETGLIVESETGKSKREGWGEREIVHARALININKIILFNKLLDYLRGTSILDFLRVGIHGKGTL